MSVYHKALYETDNPPPLFFSLVRKGDADTRLVLNEEQENGTVTLHIFQMSRDEIAQLADIFRRACELLEGEK